jgi:hypothetical protein
MAKNQKNYQGVGPTPTPKTPKYPDSWYVSQIETTLGPMTLAQAADYFYKTTGAAWNGVDSFSNYFSQSIPTFAPFAPFAPTAPTAPTATALSPTQYGTPTLAPTYAPTATPMRVINTQPPTTVAPAAPQYGGLSPMQQANLMGMPQPAQYGADRKYPGGWGSPPVYPPQQPQQPSWGNGNTFNDFIKGASETKAAAGWYYYNPETGDSWLASGMADAQARAGGKGSIGYYDPNYGKGMAGNSGFGSLGGGRKMAGIGGGTFGKMVDGVFVPTGLTANYQGNNPNRGAFNKARAARRAKYKERNPGAEGFGISSAAAGGLAQWS